MIVETFYRFAQQCDPQLLLLILDFMIESEKIASVTELLKIKLQILELTDLNDEKMKTFKAIYPDEKMPDAYIERMQETKRTYSNMYEEMKSFAEIFAQECDNEANHSLKDSDLWPHLQSMYKLDDSVLNQLYKLARFSYNCGMLTTADSSLEMARRLLPPSHEYYINCLWGKVAVDILRGNYKDGVSDIRRVNEHIDKLAAADMYSSKILKLRGWLIHWSLFVFFRVENGLEMLANFCLNDKVYLSTLQLVCPYLLRYVTTAALVLSDHKRNVLDDAMRLFEEIPEEYLDDPISTLIKAVCIDFDFNDADELLNKAKQAINLDYFMHPIVDEFMKCARSLVFENFCRLHHCIGIGPVSEQLDLTWDETEAYILDLVKNKRLNAKIDCANGNVVMEFNAISPYQTLIEKFRMLQIKYDAFTNNFEKRRVYQ